MMWLPAVVRWLPYRQCVPLGLLEVPLLHGDLTQPQLHSKYTANQTI